MTTDTQAAGEFYRSVVGWMTRSMDGGGVDYTVFETPGEAGIGGMMTKPPGQPASFWTYYITVDGIGAGVNRVKAAGGTVINGPMPVPGGDWIVQGLDPQGAMFALFSPTE